MSKESIPIGSLCSECAQYNGCTHLCGYAEQYVGQDYSSIHERTIGLPHYGNTEDIYISKSKEELIIYMYLIKRLKQIQIANIINVSQPFISQVVKKYRKLIIKNIQK